MSLHELITKQNETGANIQKIFSNIKKAPLDRRTIEFYETKKEELDSLWKEFNDRDNVIRRNFGNETEHPYFVGDFFGSISKIHYEISDELVKKQIDNKTQGAIPKIAAPRGTKEIQNVPKQTPESSNVSNKIKKQQAIVKIVEDMIIEVKGSCNQSQRFLTLQLKTIEQHWRVVKELHLEILTSMENVDPSIYNISTFAALESKINSELSSLQDIIEPIPSSNSSQLRDQLRLPRIELPKFDGKYTKWRQFRDMFLEIVEGNQLPDSQKLWYLKSSLEGEASALIKHLASTSGNYRAAWKIINDRYENPRMLVNATLNRLLSAQFINEGYDAMKSVHDTIQECMLSLQGLGVGIGEWDAILVHIFTQRLQPKTHTLWEQSLDDPKRLPTLEQFLQFLTWRFQSLEVVATKSTKYLQNEHKNHQSKVLSAFISTRSRCIICKEDHLMYKCASFMKMTPNQRLAAVQKANYCVNCLKNGHKARDCSSGSCNTCNKKHNTLLHLQIKQYTPKTSSNSATVATTSSTSRNKVGPQKLSTVLLSTIQINVQDAHGINIPCRALLDNGSQTNFITSKLFQKLGFKGNSKSINIEGIGQARGQASTRVNLLIMSASSNYNTRIEAHVLKHIVSNQPARNIDTSKWELPKNLTLADEQFAQSGPIDMLLGAGLFFSILSAGQLTFGPDLPVLQNSVFGWLVGGKFNEEPQTSSITCGVNTEQAQLNQSLEKFWKIEDSTITKPNWKIAEKRVEEHFQQNIQRSKDGRFIIRLPFQHNPTQLGSSREIALQRFLAVERKLTKNPELKSQYISFMREYEQLGHMQKLCHADIRSPNFYLPHHAVIKPDSSTTKCRVVFDASAKSSTNVSLNDILSTGPSIQDDVFSILTRFRQHKYVFTADIEKMYRQILIHQDDQQYQLMYIVERGTKCTTKLL